MILAVDLNIKILYNLIVKIKSVLEAGLFFEGKGKFFMVVLPAINAYASYKV